MLLGKYAQNREMRKKVESKNTRMCQESIQENQGEEPQLTRAVCKNLKNCEKEACRASLQRPSTISPKPRSPGCPTLSQPVKVSDFLTYPKGGTKAAGGDWGPTGGFWTRVLS